MIKRLLGSLREFKKEAIKTPVFVTIEVVLEVLVPLLMANLIDDGIDKGNMSVILQIGGILFVLALFALFFGGLAGSSAAVASAGLAKNLRKDMFYNVQKFSFSNIDKFSSSSLITRLSTDVTNVQRAFQMSVRMAARSPIMMILSLTAAFRISPRLSLIFLTMLPFLGVGLYFIIKTAFPVFRRVFKTYDKMNNVVQENLRGIRVVKAYTREDHEEEKFKTISKSIHDDFTIAERTLAFNMPLMRFTIYASMLLLAWFGAKAIVASGNDAALGLTTGQLLSLITYTMQILMSLMMLSMVLTMLTISRASAERIVEVLDEESDLRNEDNPVMEVKNGEIIFKDVCFTYSEKAENPVLKNINLTINSGDTVGVIGGTGSSKSSLIQLIPRLYDVTEGQLLVGGVDVRDYDIKTLRDQVAMVLQNNVLFSGTISENLRWGDAKATEAEILQASKLAEAHEFVEDMPMQYDTYIEQGGSNVSGGQKQRLTIARALLKDPKILILDDSTSAVDTKTDAKIREAMLEKIPDTTKIIVAQRIASVEDADLIIVMDDGHITETGTHEELLKTSEIYREVYESQMKGGSLNE